MIQAVLDYAAHYKFTYVSMHVCTYKRWAICLIYRLDWCHVL